VATPGALSLLAATATNPAELLDRHAAGDWGEVPPEDVHEKERSLILEQLLLNILDGYSSDTCSGTAQVIQAALGEELVLLPLADLPRYRSAPPSRARRVCPDRVGKDPGV
jgi:hypothetical protein